MHMIKKIKTLLVTLVALSLFASVSSAQSPCSENLDVKSLSDAPSYGGGIGGGT